MQCVAAPAFQPRLVANYDFFGNKHFSAKECRHDSIGRITPGATDMLKPLPVAVFSTSNETTSSMRNKTWC